MRYLWRSLVAMVGVAVLGGGCTPLGDDLPLPPTSPRISDESGFVGEGVVQDVSEHFVVTVYPTRISDADGFDRLVYSYQLDTDSDVPMKDVVVTTEPPRELDPYLGAGSVAVPMGPRDVAAKGKTPGPDEGLGFEVMDHRVLADDQIMKELGVKRDDIFEVGKRYGVTVAWKGGEEHYDLTAPVVNEIAD